MKNILLRLFLTLLVYCSSESVKAQIPNDAYATTSATITNGRTACTYFVELPDTVSISEIEIKLGTREGFNDLVTHVFAFDVSSGLPSGFSYSRNNNKLQLKVGNVNESPIYFGEVRLKSTSGNWDAPFKFTTN